MTDLKFYSNGQERMSIDGPLRPLGTEAPSVKLTVSNDELTAPIGDIAPGYLSFRPQNSTEIMRLDKKGMVFMGERITDAGEAYEAWMKTMALMQNQYAPPRQSLTDEEIEELYMQIIERRINGEEE